MPELIIVILIVGILALIALPKLQNDNLPAAVDQVKRDILLTQTLAMNSAPHTWNSVYLKKSIRSAGKPVINLMIKEWTLEPLNSPVYVGYAITSIFIDGIGIDESYSTDNSRSSEIRRNQYYYVSKNNDIFMEPAVSRSGSLHAPFRGGGDQPHLTKEGLKGISKYLRPNLKNFGVTNLRIDCNINSADFDSTHPMGNWWDSRWKLPQNKNKPKPPKKVTPTKSALFFDPYGRPLFFMHPNGGSYTPRLDADGNVCSITIETKNQKAVMKMQAETGYIGEVEYIDK